MAEDGRDFYVGYKPQAPAGIGRFVRRVVIVLCLAAPALAVVLVALQSPFADSTFEYGNVGRFEGRLETSPYPSLRIARSASEAAKTHLLVTFGKRGADDAVAGLDGRDVKIDGQRIYRGDSSMIELAPGAIVDVGASPEPEATERSLGEFVLAGEIVDSKCHLGVMKPGEGKTHRACAVRCISGGAPPMLWVRDGSGRERQFILAGRDGRQIGAEILDVVAEPVEVTGEVLSQGDLWILRTEPHEIQPLGPGGRESSRSSSKRPDVRPGEPHGG